MDKRGSEAKLGFLGKPRSPPLFRCSIFMLLAFKAVELVCDMQ